MTPSEIAEDLDGWVNTGTADVPSPIKEWHHVNGRYVIDGVPYTKPQTEAFIEGLSKALDWTLAVAEHVKPGSVDEALDREANA